MALLDHFHPPLSVDRHWEALLVAWAGSLADALNRVLPERCFAEQQMPRPTDATDCWGDEAVTLAAPTWAPPAPALTLPTVFADDFEVLVFSSRARPWPVAVIELVSPRNKDRPEARRTFAIKCASYLHQGIGLIVADIVTARRANLHNETMLMLQASPEAHLAADTQYAVAYRPARHDSRDEFDLWRSTFAVGQEMPVLPLYISGDLCLPVDLEAAYMDACRRRRLV